MVELKLKQDQLEALIQILNRSQFSGESAEFVSELKAVLLGAYNEKPEKK